MAIHNFQNTIRKTINGQSETYLKTIDELSEATLKSYVQIIIRMLEDNTFRLSKYLQEKANELDDEISHENDAKSKVL